MKVRFTPSGRADFLRVVSFIRRDDRAAALVFCTPAESGRLIPEFPDLPYREVIVPPFRFFYRIEGNTVWIVAVWHGAQAPQNPG